MPVQEPLRELPNRYKDLQLLLDQMPVTRSDGSAGLLATKGALEKAVHSLPNYHHQIIKEDQPHVKAALFRAYSFLSSAYTLSPAHHTFLQTGQYGLGNKKIPANLAEPFVAIADSISVFPWLDYHYAYALGNYFKKDPSKGLAWVKLGNGSQIFRNARRKRVYYASCRHQSVFSRLDKSNIWAYQ